MNDLFKYEIIYFNFDYNPLFECGSIILKTDNLTIYESINEDKTVLHALQSIYKILVDRETHKFKTILNDRMKYFKDGIDRIIRLENKQKLNLLENKLNNDIVNCVIKNMCMFNEIISYV